MNLAIDSFPLEKDIFSSSDYSGLQLYGLEHQPLWKFVKDICISKSNTKVSVSLQELFWDDGSKVLASSCLSGLKNILFNKFFRYVVFKDLDRSTYSDNYNEFSLYFNKPSVYLRSFLQIPNWVPYSKDFVSGNYRILGYECNTWMIQKNDNCALSSVFLVKTPEENIRSYYEGRIDICADTLMPLENSKDTFKYYMGIVGSLVFNTQSWLNKNNYIRVLASVLCSEAYFSNLFSDFYGFERIPLSIENIDCNKSSLFGKEIVLGYDDFYPNKLIVENIKNHLYRHLNVKLKIIEDDYYHPQYLWDIKLTLFRPIVDCDYFKACHLISFVSSKSMVKTKNIFEYISSVQRGENDFSWNAYLDLGVGIPLFQLPCMSFVRDYKNPLLNLFSEA